VVISPASSVNVNCNGGSDGSATVTASGGTAPYSFIWQNGQSGTTASGLSAGVYNVTVSDANGCSASTSVAISQPSQALISSMSSTPVSCKGGSDGSAQVAVNLGGTFPYVFNWSNGGTGQAVYNLSAGTYFVTLTDGNGCQSSSQVIVSEPAAALTGYLNSNDALCTGAANAQITAIISGGTLPASGDYFYLWSNGETGSIIGNLTVGTYTVTVTDANGCSFTLSRTVSQASPIVLNVIGTINALCDGGSDGQATVTASGGTGTIYFQWSDGQNTPTATGLSAGIYTLTVSDDNGCSQSTSVTITDGAPVQITTAINNVSCFGEADGRIEVTSAGASLYFWSNGQIANPLANLPAGQYTLTVEMANGCRSSFTYNISQPDELLTQVSVSNNLSCHNDANGSVIATVSGGTPGIFILWSNGSQLFQNSNLPAGNYSYTVTDANGCIAGSQISLSNPTALGIELSAVDARCFGDQNGSIVVSGTGGTTNFNAYEYSLDSLNWQTGDLFPALGSGTYTVYVRDNNGCVISDSVQIEAADPFSITFFSPQDTTIEYGDSISLAALVSDSSGALVSWWDVNANTLIVESVYDLTVTPANTTIYEFRAISPLGCESDSSLVVSVTKPRRAAAPGGFTPNGDGTNDSFFIQGDDKVSKVLVFRVYDRWGELVFSAENIAPNDAAAGWDGTFKGEKMNSGVYAWYAEVEYIDGFKEILKGDVTLLR
jgi:gliding motility-associated-like protein